ncbi:MAG TPA: hypothetical protein VEV17_25510 [Bryobacteraceae bacterium]|nr:hypothetical protein [Bryobacteraceae bacterium]
MAELLSVAPATTSWAPTAKVSAGMLAGSATTLLAVFLKPWFAKNNYQFTPEITTALTAMITFVVQYIVPERKQVS